VKNVNPVDLILDTLNVSHTEFAKKMGVSSSLVTMWKKRGYITQKYLGKAVEISGIPPYLLNHYIPSTTMVVGKPENFKSNDHE